MATVATGMDSARAQRWVVGALVGSLALNLVVFGAIATSLWRGGVEPSGTPLRVPRTVTGYAGTLPDARAKELKKLAEEPWRGAETVRSKLLEARTEAIKALTTEPFDKQRFLAAQSLLLAADLKYREASTKLNSAIGLHLTPEERRGFLRWREQQRPVRNPLDSPEQRDKAAQ
jgi:uncharacterized membrane protein